MKPEDYSQATIKVTGRVQGVGFRPFIYRLAVRYNLKGYVINLGDAGVEIVVEGLRRKVEKFAESIKEDAPEVSEISEVEIKLDVYTGRFNNFIIDKSRNGNSIASGIFPPDIGICPKCLEDIETKGDRWYEYPFTTCAWCGPRYTGVISLPYDRERTHMRNFPMCIHCKTDYVNPNDRRFDAQGITCCNCGPKMSLHDSTGKLIKSTDVFRKASQLLCEGNIIAIKGLGGFHIACLATEDEPINELRKRKLRPYQPFALMTPNLGEAKRFTRLNEHEVKILTSWHKPIVLLKKYGKLISDLVSPGLDRVGVMLPYTGIQVLLFKRLHKPALIMTSGNRPGLPMVISNESALSELNGIVDYYLFHNREIVNRCDDSLLRVNDKQTSFIRRSRGYVPDPIEIPIKKGIAFAVGTELSNAAAVTVNGRCHLTQYLGDTSNLETLDYEKDSIYKMRDLLKITCNPDVIACDQHPGYMTSHLAEVISQETASQLIKTQHHHAHIVSACAENNVEPDENVIGIALDGAGYGTDNTIWGGEVLISTYFRYERVGHLEQIPMPGGDLCTHYPFRMLIANLTKIFSNEEIRDITKNHINEVLPNGINELELILKQSRNPNVVLTSSSGRYLDSIASLLDLTYHRTYEGEPALRLEALASRGNSTKIKFSPDITCISGKYILKTSNLFKYLIKEKNSFKKQDIAAFSQKYLASGFAQIAKNVAKEEGINKIAITGGVLSNSFISHEIRRILKYDKIIIITNNKVPLGDGGTALGQSCIGLSHCDMM